MNLVHYLISPKYQTIKSFSTQNVSISRLQNHFRFLRCNKRAENKTLYSWQKSHVFKFDKGVNKFKWSTMAEFVGELQTYTVSLLEVIQESPCKVSSFVIFGCFTFNFKFLTSFDILVRPSSCLCIAYVHSKHYCFQASVKSKLVFFSLSITKVYVIVNLTSDTSWYFTEIFVSLNLHDAR